MYNPKFDYQPLSRTSEDGRRLYLTPDGKKLPSVTTILDRTKPEEKKQALANWKRRVGEAQAQQITTEAANRGTRMHTYLEHYVKTGQIREAGTNPYAWSSHAMAQTVIEQGLKNVDFGVWKYRCIFRNYMRELATVLEYILAAKAY